MKNSIKFQLIIPNKGATLLLALLILMTITAIALMVVKTSTYDSRASYGYRSARQAAIASRQAAIVTSAELEDKAQLYYELMKKTAREFAFAQDNWALSQSNQFLRFSKSFYQENTGLGTDEKDPSLKDLSRRIIQLGSISEPVLSQKADGYSEEYCYRRVRVDTAAAIGVLPKTRTQHSSSSEKGFRISDLNRTFYALNRDVIYANIGPFPCNN